MQLSTAQQYARHLHTWLTPHTERLVITGSIRRERPEPADVDLCLIPRCTIYRDMFGVETGRQNHAWMFLNSYVQSFDRAKLKPGQHPPKILSGAEPDCQRMTLQLPACQLDLWFATPENFANKIVNSTGSVAHNIWLATRANLRGLHWYVSQGLAETETLRKHGLLDHPNAPHLARKAGLILPAADETAFYAHLGLQYIEPENREADWLAKHIDSGL